MQAPAWRMRGSKQEVQSKFETSLQVLQVSEQGKHCLLMRTKPLSVSQGGKHWPLFRTKPGTQVSQSLSVFPLQVSQVESHGWHTPLMRTKPLSVSQGGSHFPESLLTTLGATQEVQSLSLGPSQVRQVVSQETQSPFESTK